MFILKQVKVNKYKSYTTPQEVQLESDVTTLVGKNESGKTAFLESLAKFNYFTDDEDFKFDEVQDYPRSELKQYQRTGKDQEVIVCTFQLDKETIDEINADLGEGVLTIDSFTIASKYTSARDSSQRDYNEKIYLATLHKKLDLRSDKTLVG